MINEPVTMSFNELDLARLAAALLCRVTTEAPALLKNMTAILLTHGTPAEITERAEHLIRVFSEGGPQKGVGEEIACMRLYLRILQAAGIAAQPKIESLAE